MLLTWPDARHIYLSPHLDDAVLSCGGTIFEQARCGEPVAVITLFAASPPAGVELSPFAQALHGRWQASAPTDLEFSDPTAIRRAEDRRALVALNPSIQVIHCDLLDCIYRVNPVTGQVLYGGEEAIFGALDATDPARADLRSIPPLPHATQVYAPLGIGHHIDHQIVREAVKNWELPSSNLRFYEDYPYATQPDALEEALAWHGELDPLVVPLSEEALQAKLEAVACYQSQISTFWQGVKAMAGALRAEAARVGGERFWKAGR